MSLCHIQILHLLECFLDNGLLFQTGIAHAELRQLNFNGENRTKKARTIYELMGVEVRQLCSALVGNAWPEQ